METEMSKPMVGVIPPPWKAMSARKRSNFGDYAAVIQAPVPGREPFLVNIARVLGGPQDQAAFANANATRVVKCVNAHDALVEALTEARRFIEVDYTSRASDQEGAWAHRLLKQIDQALATH